ncbi:hypothetical protein HYR69_03640 [Candidatus Sumerlaeota bacterium]|nr:hypothetical protein [Candidatus Sumerlaeota bacterium]
MNRDSKLHRVCKSSLQILPVLIAVWATCANAAVNTPTASPTPSRTPTPTPSPSPVNNTVSGYFPANDQGNGLTYYWDPTPFSGIRSYRIELKRVNQGFNFFTQIFNLPGGPGAVESGNVTLYLPRENILIPQSFEIDLVYRVRAYAGLNASGLLLYNSVYSAAAHPSADLQMPVLPDVNLPFFPPVVGVNNMITNDARPTAQESDYQYAIIRKLGSGPQSLVQNITHGIPGPFTIWAEHPPVSEPTTTSAVAGNQLFFLRPQRVYKNSAGTVLGNFDVAHKSPNVYAFVP